MAIKLVAIDIDGTLLDSNFNILPSTKEAIQKALNQGVKVVLCSGRPIAGLQVYLDELGIHGSDEYAITLNGAIIRSTDGKVITSNLVDNKFYRSLVAYGVEHNIPFNIVDADSRIITADHNVDRWVYQQAYENEATLYIRQPGELDMDTLKIAKGCYVGSEELLDDWEDKVKARFGNDLSVVRTDKYFLEILNKASNKGAGLAELTEYLNIKPDEVMALGDERNDISMFNFAGTAVCMGQGHEDAKQAADFVTASNDDDGISKAFDKFIFN